MKDDCIWCSVMECQSFLKSKLDVGLINFRFEVSSMLFEDIVQYTIIVTFLRRINKRENYSLFFAWTLISKYWSIL